MKELNKKAKEYVSQHRVDVFQKEEGKHPVFDSEFTQKYNEAVERAYIQGYKESKASTGVFLSTERIKELEEEELLSSPKTQYLKFKRECSTNKKIDLTILILCVIGLILMTINSALMIIGML